LDAIQSSNVSLPGLILYFDIKPEVSIERIDKRGEEKEMFEKLETLYDVKDNYMEFFKKIELAHSGTIIVVIDANKSITEVRSSAMQAIIDYIFMDRQTMFKSKKYKVLNNSSF
jgi:thymidylate kinase